MCFNVASNSIRFHKFLDRLKGGVHKKAQVGCGQALS